MLATGELELGTTEGLENGGLVTVVGPDAHDDLTDLDTSDGSLRLSESTTHPGLEPISSGARQHLVDADDVERMESHTNVELVLAAVLDQVLSGKSISKRVIVTLKSFVRSKNRRSVKSSTLATNPRRHESHLVGADTSGFQGFGRKLFILVRDEMNAERELVNVGLLATQVVDPDLRIRDTATEAGLRIRLVLAVPVAGGEQQEED